MSLPCAHIVADNTRPPPSPLRQSGHTDGSRKVVAGAVGLHRGRDIGRRCSGIASALSVYTVPLDTLWIKETGCRSLLPVASIHARFGRTVRALRAKAGYSQESFADAIHIHRTSMGTLERGDGNPRLETILKIARGLGVSLSELFLAVERDVGQ
jgi:DNA-binding XRE family transcriptional regulator